MPNLILNNNPLEQIILQTIGGVKQYLNAKEEIDEYDKPYQDARKFMREYRRSLWYGEATAYFLEELKQYAIVMHTKQKRQTTNGHFITAIAGMLAYHVGMCMQSQTVSLAGFVLFGYSLTKALLTSASTKKEIEQLKKTVNNPEQINKALKLLYQQER
ncbi:hypothetical protein KY309_02825 [Candidatus Woesearchaeota archaeon]|nr:hypothetical protein [Candidatus Woesearchaeota archaeon]MBW3016519.1 hypothetical protein [Candidatus Woesearchaeota archaeon]